MLNKLLMVYLAVDGDEGQILALESITEWDKRSWIDLL